MTPVDFSHERCRKPSRSVRSNHSALRRPRPAPSPSPKAAPFRIVAMSLLAPLGGWGKPPGEGRMVDDDARAGAAEAVARRPSSRAAGEDRVGDVERRRRTRRAPPARRRAARSLRTHGRDGRGRSRRPAPAARAALPSQGLSYDLWRWRKSSAHPSAPAVARRSPTSSSSTPTCTSTRIRPSWPSTPSRPGTSRCARSRRSRSATSTCRRCRRGRSTASPGPAARTGRRPSPRPPTCAASSTTCT